MKTDTISTEKPSVSLWKTIADKESLEIVNGAVEAYFNALGSSELPGEVDFEAAMQAARSSIIGRILSADFLGSLGLPNTDDSRVRAQLEVTFSAIRSRPQVSHLPVTEKLSALQFGIAALVGSVAGIVLLAPFTHFVFKNGDLGLLLGAPLGAFLLVFTVWHTARKKGLRLTLLGLLGVGTLTEALLLWRHGWSSGFAFKRIAISCVVILVVAFFMPHRRLDRKQHEKMLRAVLTHWLETATLILGCLGSKSVPCAAEDNSEAKLLDIVKQVLDLRQVATENLPVARDALLQGLRNMGFDTNTDNPQPLIWGQDLAKKYVVFGHVEEGDRVFIEREAVVLDGVVHKKGQVRKLRGGNIS